MTDKSEQMLKRGKKYIFRVSSSGQTLGYTGELIDFNDTFISFRDKFNKVITVNINNLISTEEVKEE